MKFIADEHIDVQAVEALRRIKIDIISVQELSMRGEKDKKLLEYAKDEKRVMITADTDFLKIAKIMEHAGIIFITRPMLVGDILREIQKVFLIFVEGDFKNRVIFIPLKQF